jgi:hypothetical protein
MELGGAMGHFELGDKVTWTSQSQGYWKTKTGRVVGVIPAGFRPHRANWRKYFNHNKPGGPRDHESYIVYAHPHYYWPRVSKLRLEA